ncbi:MAG: Hpt domain-containing protein [Candidatus Krumholzibacteriia bacterium]
MPADTTNQQSILDLAEAMRNLDGDAELLQEIVEIFMETAELQIQSLTDAIRDGNVQKVAIEAHAMKGGASNFCAGEFVAAALALELHAKSGSLDRAWELLETLVATLKDLREVLGFINWAELAQG